MITAIAVTATDEIFAGTYIGTFRSSDKGENWTKIYPYEATCFAFNASGHIFAGVLNSVARSFDNGDHWSLIGLNAIGVNVLSVLGDSKIYAGTSGLPIHGESNGNLFSSLDNGETWAYVISGPAVYSFCMTANGVLFAGTSGGIYRSIDNGASWSYCYSCPNNTIMKVLTSNGQGHVFAGSFNRGMYRSQDDGNSWIRINNGLESGNIRGMTINPRGDLYVGTLGGGVFHSSDNGETWTSENAGLINLYVSSITQDAQGYLYVGTDGNGVFRSTASTTSVAEEVQTATIGFVLAQNYPNPFNPSTTIRFSLPRPGFITLKIYNLLGEEVATLVQEQCEAGEHRVQWQAHDLPSGVYVYRVQAGEFVQSRKLLLMR